MKIAARYEFNGGENIPHRYPALLEEVNAAIEAVDAPLYKTKRSKEKTMPDRLLFDPTSINKAFKAEFKQRGWSPVRVSCKYTTEYYVEGYQPGKRLYSGYREMDFVNGKLGVEVQFGKYSFMVYNVCSKMTIFHKLAHIDCGIEIVPVKEFQKEMSTGVSYFGQFVWDLEQRGVADIDIPVLILGVGQ